MPFPGDEITVYYPGFELGIPSGDPEVVLGYVDENDLFVPVEPVGPTPATLPMIELEHPAGTGVQIWARRFTLPDPAPVLGTWLALVKANISAVDRWFRFDVPVESSPALRPLTEVEGASLETFGGWTVHQLRQMRRIIDRLKLSGSLLDRLNRDRILIQAGPKVVQQNEDATFEFTVIDDEAGGLLPLDGATVRFKGEFVDPPGPAWDVLGSIIDASQGRAEAIVDSSLTGTPGQVNTQVEVTLPDTSVKLSPVFLVTIEPSVP